MKPKKLWPSLCAGALLLGGTAPAQTVGSDSWAATDALGRKVRDYKEAGAKKSDKFVAMFYWTWHQGNDDTTYRVKNITEIVRQHPEAMKDYHHPAWGTKQPGFFFWEQPLLGYYKTTDPWVLRKHAEMLADAGVDAVADQRLGQSARNIGQAAGLGKGCSLAGCVQDFHKHLRASFTK